MYFGFTVSLVALVSSFYFLSLLQSQAMNELQRFNDQKSLPTIVYDVKNRIIGQFGHRRQAELSVSKLPENVIQPFISAEDQDFYHHSGVSIKGLVRALIANVRAGQWVQGASTITQQLVRNTMLTRDKTIMRKLKELILSMALERRLSKQQILERYLNILFFGHANYGIEAAAKSYFGKSASHLTWGESALLASVIKAPSKLNLRSKEGLKKALARRGYVLQRLFEDGYISKRQLIQIQNENIRILEANDAMGDFPYAMFSVERELKRKYTELNLNSGGYRIYTSLDLDLLHASKKVVDRLAKIQWVTTRKEQAIGLVLLNAKTGGVSAIWGGDDFTDSQYNVALQARRPIGAMILPHMVSRLLAYGYSLHSDFGGRNFTSSNRMRNPLAGRSFSVYELLSQRMLYESTPLAVEMGFGSLRSLLSRVNLYTKRNDYDLVWGMSEHSLLNLTASYSVFANAGRYLKPHIIEKIYDDGGRLVLDSPKKHQANQVLDASLSYLVNQAIRNTLPKDLKNTKSPSNSYAGLDLTKQNVWQAIWSDKIVAGIWWGAKHGKETIALTPQQIDRRFHAVHRYFKSQIPGLNELILKRPEGIIYRPYKQHAVSANKAPLFLPEVISSAAKIEKAKF
jgi:membrane peptidoglycan carboxypeptidase